MKIENTMLPPVPVPADVRRSVDWAIATAGVTQAEVVRQGLRFGVGRFVEAMAAANQRQPSRIRELLKDFPPVAAAKGWKAELKKSILKKYGAHR